MKAQEARLLTSRAHEEIRLVLRHIVEEYKETSFNQIKKEASKGYRSVRLCFDKEVDIALYPQYIPYVTKGEINLLNPLCVRIVREEIYRYLTDLGYTVVKSNSVHEVTEGLLIKWG